MKNIILSDPEVVRIMDQSAKDILEDPFLRETVSHKYYELTREELQSMWMKKLNHLYFKNKDFYFGNGLTQNSYWFWYHFG
jgi:hypothetical protein